MICRAALSAALAAFCLTFAYAAPLLNPADFQVIESPDQYTVINNSTDWYVYAFAVENPAASDPTIVASTTVPNWGALSPNPQLDLNTGSPVWAFAYASDDTNFSTDPPTLTAVNLGSYIAPGSFEDRFFFGTQQQASHYGLLVVAVVDQETVYESGQRSRDGHRYANPGCTSTFCGRTWPDWITRTSQEADENRLI